MKWRVVITDSESPDGVAPECPQINRPGFRGPDSHYGDVVENCCPKPHLKCVNSHQAHALAIILICLEIEVCD